MRAIGCFLSIFLFVLLIQPYEALAAEDRERFRLETEAATAQLRSTHARRAAAAAEPSAAQPITSMMPSAGGPAPGHQERS
jgi:hypothetical protein